MAVCGPRLRCGGVEEWGASIEARTLLQSRQPAMAFPRLPAALLLALLLSITATGATGTAGKD